MFKKERIKLTAWYLLIIMVISVSFSVAIYRVLNEELDRVARIQRLRIERRLPQIFPPQDDNNLPRTILFLDPNLISEAENRLKLRLMIINLAILAGSAVASYFLAGRTLEPIGKMVEEQNRFITDSSHELRTPLTSLRSEIEVNLRDKNFNLETAKKLLKSNLEEVNQLQALSDRLIKLAQCNEGKTNPLVSPVSLQEVVREACKKIVKLAKNKNIILEKKIAECTLEANKQALVELLVIFLDNAIKYSPQKTRVNLSAKRTDGHLIITIKDRGIGIKKEDLPHIFDRFYRADKSRTKLKEAGYGLGLSIAKQIVTQYKGLLWVESDWGKGTTFTIKLPLKQCSKLL